jgi:hypothetical protein
MKRLVVERRHCDRKHEETSDTLNLSMACDNLFTQSSTFFIFMPSYIAIKNAFCPPIVFKSS